MKIIEIIKFLLFLLTIAVSLYGCYFVVRFAASLFYKKKEVEEVSPQKSFAILIPARNEESTIGQLIESLQLMDYPRELYGIYTIVNNSSDRTEEIALAGGSQVITAENVKCKADALRYAFKALEEADYDYYVVFDGDNLVDSQFLKEMNNYACAGYKVAQCRRSGKNTSDSWIANCYELYYIVQNTFFNKARMKTDNTSSINGTGWMVAKKLLDEMGFPTKTLTEDVEFSGLCAKNGVEIAYVPKAVTYDEFASDFKTSWIQRKRWSAGSLQCYKIYFWDYLKEFGQKGKQMCLDYALIFLAPVVQIVSVLSIVLQLVNFINVDNTLIIVCFLAASILSGYLSTTGFALLAVIVSGGNIKNNAGGILGFGLFMTSWAFINILICFKTPTKWEPIPHKRAMSINQIK